MSLDPSSAASELRALRSDIAELRELLSALQLRVERLEQQDSAGRVATSTTATTTTYGSSGSAGTSSALGEDRVAAAKDIGRWFQRCLRNQQRGLSGREKITQKSKYYLVVRDFNGSVHDPPLFFDSWSAARESACHQGQPGDSILVGLPSLEECRIACLEAGLRFPPQTTRA